jgi:hypothetical protein
MAVKKLKYALFYLWAFGPVIIHLFYSQGQETGAQV